MPPAIAFADEREGLAIVQPFDVVKIVEVRGVFVDDQWLEFTRARVHEVELVSIPSQEAAAAAALGLLCTLRSFSGRQMGFVIPGAD